MQNLEPQLTPASYRPEFAEEARKWALMRATDEDLARHFGIPLATLHECLALSPISRRPSVWPGTGRYRRRRPAPPDCVGYFPEVSRTSRRGEGAAHTHPVPSAEGLPELLAGEPPADEWCQKVEIEAESGHDSEGDPFASSQLIPSSLLPESAADG